MCLADMNVPMQIFLEPDGCFTVFSCYFTEDWVFPTVSIVTWRENERTEKEGNECRVVFLKKLQ